MTWIYSVRFHLIFAVSLCAGLTVILWWVLTSHTFDWQHWLALWLVAVNAITLGYYGLDKWLARKPWFRIPEVVLHVLTGLGGSPAALLAMSLFRHKTIKPSFRILFWSIVLVQAALLAYLIVRWLGRD